MNRLHHSSPPLTRTKILIFSIFTTLLAYGALEALCSTLYVWHILDPLKSFWIFEESWRTVHFDPVRGYTLTSIPSRFARVTKGIVEYIGTYRGNAQGFPDRDDFFPERDYRKQVRIVVFGDSFTAAQYIEQNWPDAIEDVFQERSPNALQLLNCSVDGGGLANWWNIFTKFIQQEHYQIDGIIFAVFTGDLQRGFSVADHRETTFHMFGRSASWNPDDWPKTQEEAYKILKPLNGYIVSHAQFETALQQKKLRLQRAWRPYLSHKLNYTLRSLLQEETIITPQSITQRPVFDSSQEDLINQFRARIKQASLPVLVVHIPGKEELLQQAPPPEDVLRFADVLNAEFIDGRLAFAGLSEEEIASHFLLYDGHWSQKGSDRFAQFIVRKLETSWLSFERSSSK